MNQLEQMKETIQTLNLLIKQREEHCTELEKQITALKEQVDDLSFDLMKVKSDRDYWKRKCSK